MTLNRSHSLVTLLALGAAGLTFAADPVPAQTPETSPATSAPQPSTSNVLSLSEIESRLEAQGLRVKEMEVHDKVLDVEAYDAQGRELDLIVDRRSGEILSRKFDD